MSVFDHGMSSPNPKVYYYTGPPGPPGPFGPPGPPGNLNDTAFSFVYAQLANVLTQLIQYYPTTVLRAYTIGFAFTFAGLEGTPVKLLASPDASYGGLFVMEEGAETGALPLHAIASLAYAGGVAYNPAIHFIPKPKFPPGWDYNIITAVHDNLTVGDAVTVYTGGSVEAKGVVYKNPYGMIVIADDLTGINPTFIPITNLTGILRDTAATGGKGGAASKLAIPYEME